jgi:antitoxin component of MazEF toxin-antitoxin module
MVNIKKFEGKVWKTGNSFVVTIPDHIWRVQEISEGDIIAVNVEKK